jgi:hypothetical protein
MHLLLHERVTGFSRDCLASAAIDHVQRIPAKLGIKDYRPTWLLREEVIDKKPNQIIGRNQLAGTIKTNTPIAVTVPRNTQGKIATRHKPAHLFSQSRVSRVCALFGHGPGCFSKPCDREFKVFRNQLGHGCRRTVESV